MQFIADTRGNKLIVIKWDNKSTEYLKMNGFVFQDTVKLDVHSPVAYVKEFESDTELKKGMDLLLKVHWGVTFL